MLIDPVDDPLLRAEIDRKPEKLKRHLTDPVFPRIEKQSHLRFPETINGLHGIAHHEQGVAIARLPTGRQPFEQLELIERGILKLVHQQVPNTIVQRQREVRRRFGIAQCPDGRLRQGGKIHPFLLAKYKLQVSGRHTQQLDQSLQGFPLIIGVLMRRQPAQQGQAFTKCVFALQ